MHDQPPTRDSTIRPFSRRHLLGVTALLGIAALSQYRATAVTCCQRARNKPDFHGADRKRAFRQKMDGRAADRQLQGPDRQVGDQAEAGHVLRSANRLTSVKVITRLQRALVGLAVVQSGKPRKSWERKGVNVSKGSTQSARKNTASDTTEPIPNNTTSW